jgi:hypothetical protein
MERPTPSIALRISRTATWTASAGPPELAPFLVAPARVDLEWAAVVSVVMARHLLQARPWQATAAIGLQLIGQLPVRVEQPPVTRFEVSAAPAAVERGQETTNE